MHLLRGGNRDVKRMPFAQALRASTTHANDLVHPYVDDLKNVINVDAIKNAEVKIGADPLAGRASGIGSRSRNDMAWTSRW